jgi:hypothetical protein
VSVSDLNIPTIDLHILLQEIYGTISWEYINRSQTHECGNWDCGRPIPRKGIHKWDFPCSVGLSSRRLFNFRYFPKRPYQELQLERYLKIFALFVEQ